MRLLGCALDNMKAPPHTLFMLSCCKSVLARSLPLLGLVVLMLVVASSGFAAETSLDFPILSPRADQANMLANAFVFQMKLFTGLTSDSSGLSAVKVLAALGAMIGAMLIIFFPKYQKMPVVATWLLLVIIVLFVPLGSKLLFYPIKSLPESPMIAFNGTPPPVQDGQPCLQNSSGCGFTPQLVAVHLGSVMQMITSDIFRSAAWDGLIERQKAATELYTMPDFDLGEGWLSLREDYEQCNAPLQSILDPGATSTQNANSGVQPDTLEKVWNSMGRRLSDSNGNFSEPPPYIVFPTTLAQAKSLGWNTEGGSTVTAYEAGIKALCEAFCSPDAAEVSSGATKELRRMSPVLSDGGGVEDGQATVADILANIKTASPNLFDYKVDRGSVGSVGGALLDGFYMRSGPVVGPGVFFAVQDGDKISEDQIKTRTCYVPNPILSAWDDPGALVGMQNYITNNANTACTSEQGSSNLYLNQQYNPKFHASTYKYVTDNYLKETGNDSISNEPSPWNELLTAMRKPEVAGMPVGVGDFSTPAATNGSGTKYPTKTIALKGSLNCLALGQKIVNGAIGSLEKRPTGKQTDAYFDKLVAMLKGGAIPDKPVLSVGDLTSVSSADLNANPAKKQMVENMASRMTEAIRRTNMDRTTDKQKAKRAAMVNSLLELDMRVTMQTAGKDSSGAFNNAATDGVSMNPEMVGLNMVYAGKAAEGIGGVAFGLGRIMAKIGALLTGPLAMAFLMFLTVLVDFTLMIIISITPLLFLFGLVIPTVASGVLTIAVLSVFILKFVPVTLIILNGIAGMIYNLLPASVGVNADFMRDLLIIAMGGLYMNIVGLTFFLMFKLGDPAAFLGRLTALDGQAKELANRGMTATKALAGLAALGVAGAAGGAIGAGRLRSAANRAADALGVPPELRNAAGAMLSEEKSKTPQGGGNESSNKDQTVDGYTPEEFAALSEDQQQAILNGSKDFHELGESMGFDQGERNRLLAGETVRGHKMSSENGVQDIIPLQEGTLPTGRSGEENAMFQAYENRGTPQIPSTPPSSGSGTPGAPGVLPQPNQPNPDGTPNTAAGAQAPESRQIGTGDTGNTAVNNSGAMNGIPAQVTVVGGRLDNIGAPGATDVQTRVNALKAEDDAQKIHDETTRLERIAADTTLSSEQRAAAQAGLKDMANATTADDAAGVMARADSAIQKVGGQSIAKIEAAGVMRRNMNDQIADEKAKADLEISTLENGLKTDPNNKSLQSQLKTMTDYRKNLDGFDTARATQAEMVAQQSSLSNLKRSLALRGQADTAPGILTSAYSGLIGAYSGGGGGLARIPVIGPAITEALNEVREAPERARAWNAAGGRQQWKEANTNAQRLGFYQKHAAPIAAGAQYENMMAVGAFQAQVDLSRQAAGETVARSRTQWEALVASNKDIRRGQITTTLKAQYSDPEQLNIAVERQLESEMVPDSRGLLRRGWDGFRGQVTPSPQVLRSSFKNAMSAGDLAGIGRFEAADRIGSVRQEAWAMQGANAKIEVVKGGLTTDMKLKPAIGADGKPTGRLQIETETQDVILTADALNMVRGQLSAKKISGNIDDMMITHYGIAEKQYLRGNADWDQTRGMTSSAAATRMFIRKDVDTDYTIAGHLKMVEGKIGHKDREGQYKTLLEFRNDENKMKQAFLDKSLRSLNGDLTALYKAADVDLTLPKFSGSGASAATARREALDKWAVKQLQGTLKLENVFDEAASNGMKKYVEKSLLAPFNMQAQDYRIYQSVQKAATSGMKSLPGMNTKAFSQTMMNLNGQRASMDSALDSWFDTMLKASGYKMDKMSQIFSAVNGVLTDKSLGDDNIQVDSRKADDNSWGYSQYSLTPARARAMQKALAGVDDDAAKWLDERLNDTSKKNFDSRGNFVYANIAIDKNGNIRKNLDRSEMMDLDTGNKINP